MHWSSFHSLPPFFLLLAALLAVVVFVLQIGILGYAYEKIGIHRRTAYLILLLSLLGSYVNIPVAEVRGQPTVQYELSRDDLGRPVVSEHWGQLKTVLALNVGGAIIPTILSIHLLVKNQLYIPAIAGTAFVSAVVFYLAELTPEGVKVPILAPPIVSAAVAMLLARHYAAPLAYISGCLGTLIGADLLNLGPIVTSGASLISIGGAGTFDGVFLTGMLAVLLAVSPRPVASADDEPPPN